MNAWTEALTGASPPDLHSHRPVIIRPSTAEGQALLQDLLQRDSRIVVHDHLHSQLRELVKALNPSVKWEAAALDEAARAHLAGVRSEEYGVWVHYPWSHRLIHLLDEPEFTLVRTDRNRNKITKDEQAVLSGKRVGVIGLSVGQSVSLALAMERSFGELRLADFDTLDLSNLNRIRSGVQSLGLNKTVNVAREIAEIDPFLQVTIYPEGITEGNLDDFFTRGGKLDLLVEECDSVAVKILARQKAKDLRVPVVMDTSDRGLIDVERFDLEPERPILHGLVAHLDLAQAAKARTNEEKLPFVVPVIGLDTMSARMKASMLEIESTVGTWPQLASSVVLGGAIVADLHRRMALGQFTSSGRWFIDPEELLQDRGGTPNTKDQPPLPEAELMSDAQMTALANNLDPVATSDPLSGEQFDRLVSAAILAPSAGNLQPWRFMLHEGSMLVFHDAERGDSPLDGGRLIPAMDMGACLENIRLAASAMGLGLRTDAYPTGDHRLVARVQLSGRTTADPLAANLALRCTNRKKGNARALPNEVTGRIAEAVALVPDCSLHVIDDRASLAEMAEVIGGAERLRVLHPLGHHDLFRKELRWTSRSEERPLDGLEIGTLELKSTEEVGFRVAADRAAMDLLAAWNAGRGFMKMTREQFQSASGLMLIATRRTDASGLLDAGRAMQRAWLAASGQGIAVHPCAAPILLSHHVRFAGGKGISEPFQRELLHLHDRLRGIFALEMDEPVFMMRLSFAPSPTARSLRRPTSAVIARTQSPA